MERRVIHLNIADFAVAAERLIDRSLKTKPLIIAAPTARSVVYDMSEEVYQEGVRKGMPLSTARRLCRSAILLPPRPERYERAMGLIAKTAFNYTPLVERSSGDGHFFLDVTGTHRLFGPAPDIGWRIRKTIRNDIGFNPIWAAAPNKLVAKVASRLVKPVGEYVVAEGEEEAFLAPLPLSLLPGLNQHDIIRLREFNLTTISQLTGLSLHHLTIIHSKQAGFLHRAVRGIDSTPVMPPASQTGRLVFHHQLADDSNDDQVIRAGLLGLSSQAGQTLRSLKKACLRISISLRYSDSGQETRQITIKKPLNDDMDINHVATTVLYRAWRRRIRLRRISLCCERLIRPVRQLSIFAAVNRKNNRQESLNSALDAINKRYATGAISRARQQNPSLATP